MLNNLMKYKRIYDAILEECCETAKMGIQFYPETKAFLRKKQRGKVEFATGSRYMPRGYYCPSPDMEYNITNMKRGKIPKRLSQKSTPTNFYMFDLEDKLYFAQTIYSNGSTEDEYIVYADKLRLGYTYDNGGSLEKISREEYTNGGLTHYIWAYCRYNEAEGYSFPKIFAETIDYLEDDQIKTETFIIDVALDKVYIAHFINAYKQNEEGKLILQGESKYSKAIL